MDKRLTFNENAANYDRWRPLYCEALFRDVLAYSRIGQDCQTVEIGIGTGQATGPFVRTGCSLTAVELGGELAAYSRQKFQQFSNFKVTHTSFEAFECPEASIDLIYSATAFHWIPESAGYPKVFRLLKPGGTVALFWNRPYVGREDDALHQSIQQIYHKYRPSGQKLIEYDTSKYDAVSNSLRTYGFEDVRLKLYHMTRSFTAPDYIALLNTYSDHRTMPSADKEGLEQEIAAAIIHAGNILHVYDTIDLHLARK
ncbi:class I SAM-dependent methyltransferase [Paenibacillus sp. MMS20-IR301]|uniref:class I SAM-dependent methyltransferase n=1 Tax=Paenibacillus sp. MMS20-IR301 TaxID=2895946 RepID=UPI0028E7A49A|nr:class I SAM-dependent methyltransferase [Paenibacillus sp. MMS20-IR301]WNS46273.1 class I SAM-dependent methyltransferase [Paenibacillus sp. MMS20-IR301]